MNKEEQALLDYSKQQHPTYRWNMDKEARQLIHAVKQSEKNEQWLWSNCKIVYWPKDGSYPLEHNLRANKDQREAILTEAEKPHGD